MAEDICMEGITEAGIITTMVEDTDPGIITITVTDIIMDVVTEHNPDVTDITEIKMNTTDTERTDQHNIIEITDTIKIQERTTDITKTIIKTAIKELTTGQVITEQPDLLHAQDL